MNAQELQELKEWVEEQTSFKIMMQAPELRALITLAEAALVLGESKPAERAVSPAESVDTHELREALEAIYHAEDGRMFHERLEIAIAHIDAQLAKAREEGYAAGLRNGARDERIASKAEAEEAAALAARQAPDQAKFTEWLAREMPAGTVIGDPAWWAPRVIQALLSSTAQVEPASTAAEKAIEALEIAMNNLGASRPTPEWEHERMLWDTYQAAINGLRSKPKTDCNGDPANCPSNEGYGCICSHPQSYLAKLNPEYEAELMEDIRKNGIGEYVAPIRFVYDVSPKSDQEFKHDLAKAAKLVLDRYDELRGDKSDAPEFAILRAALVSEKQESGPDWRAIAEGHAMNAAVLQEELDSLRAAVPVAWSYECRQPHTDPAIWCEFFNRNKPADDSKWIRNVAPLYRAAPLRKVDAKAPTLADCWRYGSATIINGETREMTFGGPGIPDGDYTLLALAGERIGLVLKFSPGTPVDTGSSYHPAADTSGLSG